MLDHRERVHGHPGCSAGIGRAGRAQPLGGPGRRKRGSGRGAPTARMRRPCACAHRRPVPGHAGAPGERVQYDLEGGAHARTGSAWPIGTRDKGAPLVGLVGANPGVTPGARHGSSPVASRPHRFGKLLATRVSPHAKIAVPGREERVWSETGCYALRRDCYSGSRWFETSPGSQYLHPLLNAPRSRHVLAPTLALNLWWARCW